MGKAGLSFKKMFLLAATGFLALATMSCSRNLEDLQNGGEFGYSECSGTLGVFEIYTVRTNDPAIFEVYVIPKSVTQPTDIGSITIANQTPSYRTLVREVVFNNGEEILAGYVTETDLLNFDILALTLYDGSGASFLEQNSERDAICELPDPNSAANGNVGYAATSLRGVTGKQMLRRNFSRNRNSRIPRGAKLPKRLR